MIFNPHLRLAGAVLGWSLVGAAVIQAYSLFVPYSLAWNQTASIPRGLYLAKSFDKGPLERGQLVCFRYQPPSWAQPRAYFPEGFRLCKPVAGIEGDVVEKDANTVRVRSSKEGPLLTQVNVAPADRSGRALDTMSLHAGPVAAGNVLLLAPRYSNSFDSRYLGPIEISKVTHRIWPIWTYE